jgi:alkylation response protein AidB-like acyl-CoA dehydrogenase
VARASLNSFVELAMEKTPYRSQSLLRERAQAQLALAEAEATLRAGRAFLFETIAEMWDEVCAGRRPTKEQRVAQKLAATHAVASAVKAVELVHSAAGATANFKFSPLERQFRDVHVVRDHVTVSPAFFETAGRSMLDLEVDPGSY